MITLQRARASAGAMVVLLAAMLALVGEAAAQPARTYNRADTLRGSWDTPGRAWWNVTFYDLHVSIRPADSTIAGHNAITYRVLAEAAEMQIDLIEPLRIDSVVQDGVSLAVRSEGAAHFVTLQSPQRLGEERTVTVYYGGRPRIAPRPPWDGGFTWTEDSLGRPWVVTTSQGIGASVWWPNKDTQADEPDSQRVALTVPTGMIHVGNGRLRATKENADGTTTFEWFSANPINNYAIAVAAGSYVHFGEIYEGEAGPLTLDFWPISYNLDAARRQFAQVRPMLQCFEHWFGPYPFYEDGYKLIEVPNTGMEHQTAVTYGNRYANGYRGRDLSGTGWGMRWDFIIIHESAHEWWGNSITTKDLADMWVHESFGNYAEGLYTECLFGKEAGSEYIIGTRSGIRNDRPIIPAYGVNAQGSGDMYPKGGNMLHTIRQILADDEKWRAILRGMNETFRHQLVMGTQIEEYMSREVGVNLGKVFDQYLRTTMVPVLEYRIDGSTLHFRWTDVVSGFDMPVDAIIAAGAMSRLRPTEHWQTVRLELAAPADFRVSPDYYIRVRQVEG